jgi:hypothetical protein
MPNSNIGNRNYHTRQVSGGGNNTNNAGSNVTGSGSKDFNNFSNLHTLLNQTGGGNVPGSGNYFSFSTGGPSNGNNTSNTNPNSGVPNTHAPQNQLPVSGNTIHNNHNVTSGAPSINSLVNHSLVGAGIPGGRGSVK